MPFPILAAIAGSAASSAASFGLSKLFGGDDSAEKAINGLSRAPSVNFNAGGLSVRSGDRLKVTPTKERSALIGSLASTFPQQANLIRGLRQQVTPGFGRLTQARLDAIANARRRTVGDLRQNLARRRVLGSSFGQDAIARAEAEFAQQETVARAQSFLEELQLTQGLANEEFEARRGEFQTLVNELNLQAETALKLASGAQAELGANMRTQAQIAAKALQGEGAFIDHIVGPVANSIGAGITKSLGG